MRECRKCKASIPRSIVIEGKRRNLSNRKFCFDCSPWGNHNTRADIDKPKALHSRRYNEMTDEEKAEHSRNTYLDQKKRRFDRKKKFVLLKGGCCAKCGYDKNLAALTFHHREPEKKSFGISSRELAMYKESRLLDEVDKCDLLCHNCHNELHNLHLSDWK